MLTAYFYLVRVKIAVRKPVVAKRILGIDPGSNVLGYAVVEEIGNQRKLIAVGVHKTKGEDSHPEKLRSIFDCITSIILQYKPSDCALESPFFGKNVQSMLKLGRAQGVSMAAAIAQGLTVSEYAPKKIKMSVTGSGNASKEQVAEMACTLLGFDRTGLLLDATDAVATAICHLNQRVEGTGARKSYNSWKNFMDSNPSRITKV